MSAFICSMHAASVKRSANWQNSSPAPTKPSPTSSVVRANLKRYKASVLKVAVEGPLVVPEATLARREGRSYETGKQLLQRVLGDKRVGWDGRGGFKLPVAPETAELPDVPEGWTWASVDQLAAPGSRSITDGPFGSNLKSAHYVEDGPRVIRLQNIKDGEFEDAYAHITQEHFESLRKHEIFPGDLVIASLGENPPRACIIPAGVGSAIVKADCIRFKPHPSLMLGFLNVALNCQPTRSRVKDALHGIGRPRLSLSEIRAIALPIPPAAEQVRIVAEVDRLLSIVREVENEVDANLQHAQALWQSVLQRFFSGELHSTIYG
ncbi:MAG: restriction endonuclease subunit S [Acidovorax sp.]|uniref:restriction endonuclease subunit S n=1 Tax=Acidovorax sp. TaxID=1872122 RepID=UPI0039E313CD